jgi:hypothetical protein
MTKTQLLQQLERLQSENTELKHNPNYGILTRKGLEIEHRKLTGSHHVVMIDIDYLHQLNDQYGDQEPVNTLIRSAFSFRDDDLLISGNWASGDEVAFIVKTDPQGFMFRLAASLANYGLSATMASEPIHNNLIEACQKALQRVYATKKLRGIQNR